MTVSIRVPEEVDHHCAADCNSDQRLLELRAVHTDKSRRSPLRNSLNDLRWDWEFHPYLGILIGPGCSEDLSVFARRIHLQMLLSTATQIVFSADDGYRLVGTLYESRPSIKPNRAVLINSGAGISASYYGRFAAWLAEAGIPTLTYDYRGIGLSRPASLRRFAASVEEWGSKDCAAATQVLSDRYPNAAIAVVGHSIGCFLTGFGKWRPAIDRMLFVAPHTGYYGDYTRNWLPLMWLAWHVLMPTITRAFGYFPGRFLGLPEDLPRGVALEWADRRRPEFWWNLRRSDGSPDTEMRDQLLRRFAAFRGSVLAIRASDDVFSTSAGVRRVAALYPNVEWKDLTVSPSPDTQTRVGHFGFFRSAGKHTLWPIALTWLLD